MMLMLKDLGFRDSIDLVLVFLISLFGTNQVAIVFDYQISIQDRV